MAFFSNTVVFVRHGETEWNREKKTQGHLDSPLTQTGTNHVREVAGKLGDYHFEMILSSPLGRAVQTATILQASLPPALFSTHPDLAERNLGVLQGKTKEELIREFPNFWDENGQFIQNSEIPQGESLQKFLLRTQRVIKEIQDIAEKKAMLIVTHDGVLHAIAAHLKGIDLDEVQKLYRFRHGEPVIFK